MRVFHIKDPVGLLLLVVMVLFVVGMILGLPAFVTQVVWNATVFEMAGGPEINLIQGLLLWLMVLVALKLVLNPTLVVEFHRVSDDEVASRKLADWWHRHHQDHDETEDKPDSDNKQPKKK